jgi:hypothetical protein
MWFCCMCDITDCDTVVGTKWQGERLKDGRQTGDDGRVTPAELGKGTKA